MGLPMAAAFKHFKVQSNLLHAKTQDAVHHQSPPWLHMALAPTRAAAAI
jgi:hypothetical protein